jgi:four helix bundle protein
MPEIVVSEEIGCGMLGIGDAFRCRRRHFGGMSREKLPTFAEWAAAADDSRTGDPLWSVQAFRLGLYAIECHTADRRAIAALSNAPALDQATRAIGSIAANIAEGYSRASITDRNRFYGYALGSTREAIAWYDTLRIELADVATERQSTLIQVRRLLLTTLKRARSESALAAISDTTRTPSREDR